MFKKSFLFSIFIFTLISLNINAAEVQLNTQSNNATNATQTNNSTNASQNTQNTQQQNANMNATSTTNGNVVNNVENVANNNEPDPKNVLYIELKDGVVIAELFPTKAPLHVQRIRTLTQEGFYDGLKFHRVIDGFMAQTGDPTGTGRGGSRLGKLYAEFNDEHHTKGTLSMARASDPNSANSQFFIVTGEFFPELDGQYTVFGRVIDGMDYVEKIKVGDVSKNGMVDNPDIMIKVATGDMLNNKSIETIQEEIKIVNDMQNEKKKADPNYQNKSVLGILLETKDIDINESAEQPSLQNNTQNNEQQPQAANNGTQNNSTTNTNNVQQTATVPNSNANEVNQSNTDLKNSNQVNSQENATNNNAVNNTTTNTQPQQNTGVPVNNMNNGANTQNANTNNNGNAVQPVNVNK